jgi:hypothetical protein
MIRSAVISALLWAGVASADPHAEMAAALTAQADLHPAAPSLPTSKAKGLQQHASATGAQHAAEGAARAAQNQADAQANAAAHRAQAAANAAAAQQRAEDAKANHPAHPHPTH